jgi:hypothetical protein
MVLLQVHKINDPEIILNPQNVFNIDYNVVGVEKICRAMLYILTFVLSFWESTENFRTA